MGDDAFFGSIRRWLDRHRHGFVTGAELLRHFQRWTDSDLQPIYAGYLADPDAPVRLHPVSAGTRAE
jgi:aminopeptidase N